MLTLTPGNQTQDLKLTLTWYAIGEVEPENLTDEDLGLLLPYVTKMLVRLSDLGVADNMDEEQNVLKSAAEQAMETEMKQGIMATLK